MLFIWSSTASATPPNLSQKYLHLNTKIDYLNTSENFDKEGGGIEELPNNNFYERYNLSVSALYTFATDMALDLGFAFASAKSSNSSDDRTNTQFTEVVSKVYYQLSEKPFELIPELTLVIPFNRVDNATDEVLTGEGALQFSAGSWLVKDFGIFYVYLYAAYNYRDEGRSHLLPWSLGTEFDFNGFYVGAEGFGFESLTDDAETQNTNSDKSRVPARVDASSLSFYAINPQEIAIKGWVGFDFSKYFLTKIAYSQGINGQNYGVNRIVSVMFEYKLDMTDNEPKRRSIIDRKARKKLQDFEVDDEKYEEELFDSNKQRQRRKQKVKDQHLLEETEKIIEDRQ